MMTLMKQMFSPSSFASPAPTSSHRQRESDANAIVPFVLGGGGHRTFAILIVEEQPQWRVALWRAARLRRTAANHDKGIFV